MAEASVIGRETVVRGNVRGSGGLEILGRVEGDVSIEGDVLLGDGEVLLVAGVAETAVHVLADGVHGRCLPQARRPPPVAVGQELHGGDAVRPPLAELLAPRLEAGGVLHGVVHGDVHVVLLGVSAGGAASVRTGRPPPLPCSPPN